MSGTPQQGGSIQQAAQQQQQKQDIAGTVAVWVENKQLDYAKVLPSHIDAAHYVRLVTGLLRRNEDLAQAAMKNPTSFLSTLLDCARLGHEPGTDQYALVPFNNKNAPGGVEVVGIEQYQGEIERMYRAGAVTAVVCQIVYENDAFEYSPGSPPLHQANWFASEAERGKPVGVYAYARFSGGVISQVVMMGESEIARHREVAKTKNIWDGPFKMSMWKKTAIHELEKWVPTSAEYRREQIRSLVEAQQVSRTTATQVDIATGEIVDPEDE